MRLLWAIVVAVLSPLAVQAHQGGLDASGCHRDRLSGGYHCHHFETQEYTATPKARTAFVKRVVDGDTLVVAGGERVRLIGVDTPETKHPKKPVQRFGREATAFTRRHVEGKTVRLELDPENALRRHRDRNGRLLAYVFLPDGKLLNLEIIRQGYGFAYTVFPFARIEQFRTAQREAREQKRGLWSR